MVGGELGRSRTGAQTAGTDQSGPTGSGSGAGIRCPGPLGSGQGSGLDHVVTSGSVSEPGPDGAETSGWHGAAPDCSGWGGWGTQQAPLVTEADAEAWPLSPWEQELVKGQAGP